jgi:urease accessory protein
MIEIKAKLKVPRGAYRLEVKGQLKLPFDARKKSRLRTQLASGEEVALNLARGEILRGGDLVVASDGRVIEVVAEIESVLHVTCKTVQDVIKVAYHLGNRHLAAEVGDGYLRIAADQGLGEMLKGFGAAVEPMQAPFEPEVGAYEGGHKHNDDEQGHSGRIHHDGEGTGHSHDDHAHSHDHAHVHGPDCGHDHGHDHHDHDHDHTHAPHDHKHK